MIQSFKRFEYNIKQAAICFHRYRDIDQAQLILYETLHDLQKLNMLTSLHDDDDDDDDDDSSSGSITTTLIKEDSISSLSCCCSCDNIPATTSASAIERHDSQKVFCSTSKLYTVSTPSSERWKQQHPESDNLYQHFFIWKISQSHDVPVSQTIQEISVVVIFDLALLFHYKAIRYNRASQYYMSRKLYHTALDLLQDYMKKDLPKNHNSQQKQQYMKWTLVYAAILNNLLHIHQYYYHISEVFDTIHSLEYVLDYSRQENDDDNFNTRNHRDRYQVNGIDDDDYDFFEMNIRFIKSHHCSIAPVA